ncbi:MAG: glycoside hydrolase domain-containing protein, partial [Ktedonobacterales bacterium]
SQMQTWWNDSYYAWIGFYLGGPNDPKCSVATSGWISTIESQGWNLVPLYDGLAAPCATNNSLNMSYDTTTAYSKGEGDAKQAENIVDGLGIQVPIIHEDMEPFDQYNSSCNAAVAAYASGWTTQLNNDGFLAGLYEYYANVPALVSGASNMPIDIYVSNGGCSALKQSNSCTVWNVSGISNGWFLNDQRLYQYAFNFQDCYPAGQNCLNVDADATSGLVYGGGGGDSDANGENEGGGAQASDP